MTDLLDTVGELTHLRDKDDLEVSLARVVFELAGATRLAVWRVFLDGEIVRIRERLCLPAVQEAGASLALGVCAPEWREAYAARRYAHGPAGAGGTRHVFPICNERKVTGFMEIIRPSRLEAIEEHEVGGLLRVYCNHVGLLDYGDRDELTGLLNRRSFNGFFKHASDGPSRQAVISVVDIDFFKRINDQFGHPYGDEVLILLARLMMGCFPGVEGLFRFGGEEFVVILPDCTLEEGYAALDGFRMAVAETAFPQVGRVTVSIGIARIPPGDTGAAAFGRADEALYVAKHSGRNNVQCYEVLVGDGTLPGVKQAGGVELF